MQGGNERRREVEREGQAKRPMFTQINDNNNNNAVA